MQTNGVGFSWCIAAWRVAGARLGVALGLIAAALVVQAQTITPEKADNDALIRGQERARQLQEQQETQPDVRLPRPESAVGVGEIPKEESPCFEIERIELVGQDAEQFAWALAAAHRTERHVADVATGRCLGARGVNLVMGRVQNAIVARGYVTTRVLAAPQDLASRMLHITVVPGRIRDIRFAPGTSPRARHANALPAHPGDILNLRAIEQALENFKRVPTVATDIQITPAEGADAQPGQSDVVIVWRQPRAWRVNASADDAGAQATGTYQGSVTLSYDHPLTLNDLFYVNINRDLGGGDAGSRGTRGHTAHYSVPYGYWLLSTHMGRSRYYQSVAGANQMVVFSGESQTADLKLSRLVYRDAVRKTTLGLSVWSRSSKNFIDDTEVQVQRRRVAGWAFNANHREYIGRATLDANLGYRRGTGANGALTAPEEAFNEGTSRLQLISADAQFALPLSVLNQSLRYSAAWRAQFNRTLLVPQDRFSIGNRYTVRGFNGENLLSAERGWFVRNDVDWALGPSGQTLYLGLDYGEVGGPSSDALAGKQLAGAALGLRGAYKGASYDVFVATPIKEPDRLPSTGSVTGFNVSWSY